MRIAIVCYSLTGHTAEMAGEIAAGIAEAGVESRIFNIREGAADMDYIQSSDGLIIGTPTYTAASVWQITRWLQEDSRALKLGGKLGGAFATAHFAHGGQDTAIRDILGQMLAKGMLVYSSGSSFGMPIIHHGPVALDKEGNHYEECRGTFRIFGQRFAAKTKELFAR